MLPWCCGEGEGLLCYHGVVERGRDNCVTMVLWRGGAMNVLPWCCGEGEGLLCYHGVVERGRDYCVTMVLWRGGGITVLPWCVCCTSPSPYQSYCYIFLRVRKPAEKGGY